MGRQHLSGGSGLLAHERHFPGRVSAGRWRKSYPGRGLPGGSGKPLPGRRAGRGGGCARRMRSRRRAVSGGKEARRSGAGSGPCPLLSEGLSALDGGNASSVYPVGVRARRSTADERGLPQDRDPRSAAVGQWRVHQAQGREPSRHRLSSGPRFHHGDPAAGRAADEADEHQHRAYLPLS